MADPMVHALARELVSLRRHIRQVEVASQGAHRSIEDGSIDAYDDTGVLRERFGKQRDGTFGRKSFTGEVPPAPSEPDAVAIGDGLVAVTWDGRFEERYGGDFRNVQVHLGPTSTFTPTRNTQEGAIFARRGGTIVCVTESDDDNPAYVRLVATNNAGQESAPSDAALVDEIDANAIDEADEMAEVLDDLYDVESLAPADRELLAFNTATGLWKPYGPVVHHGTAAPETAKPAVAHPWQFYVKHT